MEILFSLKWIAYKIIFCHYLFTRPLVNGCISVWGASVNGDDLFFGMYDYALDQFVACSECSPVNRKKCHFLCKCLQF